MRQKLHNGNITDREVFLWKIRHGAYEATPAGMTALQLRFYNQGVEAAVNAINEQLRSADIRWQKSVPEEERFDLLPL